MDRKKRRLGSTLAPSIGNYAWYATDSTSTTHPTPTVTDYRGPASGTARFVHGSGFAGANSGLRIADRGSGAPTIQINVFGFLVVAR